MRGWAFPYGTRAIQILNLLFIIYLQLDSNIFHKDGGQMEMVAEKESMIINYNSNKLSLWTLHTEHMLITFLSSPHLSGPNIMV